MGQQARTKNDPAALAGFGFPMEIGLAISGTFPATTTNQDCFIFPLELATEKSGAAAILSSAQIFAQTPGDRTTGSYTITLTRVSASGTVIGTIATLSLPASGAMTLIDLRDNLGNGCKFAPGEGIRVDAGAAATGGTTSAANIRVRLLVETYGVNV